MFGLKAPQVDLLSRRDPLVSLRCRELYQFSRRDPPQKACRHLTSRSAKTVAGVSPSDDATPTSGAGKDTRSFQHNQLRTTKAPSRPFGTSLTGVASDESTMDNLDGQILTSPPLVRLLLASILPPN